jgi:uncharacterized protein (DUF885 family)
MIDRRHLLAGAAAVAASSALPAAAQMQPQAGAQDGLLRSMLDGFFEEELRMSPEGATQLGLDTGRNADLRSKLSDRSDGGRSAELGSAKTRLVRLRRVDRTRLGPAARIDYDTVRYDLETYTSQGEQFFFGSVEAGDPYVISQLGGAYQFVPDFLDSTHTIGNAGDVDTYLSRLSAFPTALDQDLARSRSDAAALVIPPDFAVDTALAQLKGLRSTPAAQSVMVTSLARRAGAANLAADPSARAIAIVAGQVYPALDRQIAWMEELRAKAPAVPGVHRLPQGDAYYAAALEAATTTKLTPDEVHRMGVSQVAEIQGQLESILSSMGLTTGTVAARLDALGKQPANLYPNTDAGRAELLAALNGQIKALEPVLPRYFGTLPRAPVEVRAVPTFIQDGAPNGYYNRAALDGSRPAIYYINLKDTAEWPRFGLPTLTYHEVSPGHHLQVSLQQENQDVPLIRRTALFGAYTEGWALYAEQLAAEIGQYNNDPAGMAGFLQSFLFRAVRLVVDTGLHAKRWSRQQAIDYMVDNTGFAVGRVTREIDRYAVWPGQACSYKVGHTMWLQQRERARAALGARFDLRAFHDATLKPGAMPLTVLSGVVGEWIGRGG